MAGKASYRQVKSEILHRIRNRKWPPGHRIPGEIELADEFGCARATVNRALCELSDDGFVERKRRAGTHVKSAPVRHARLEIPLVRVEIESSGADYRYALILRKQMDAPGWISTRLAVPTRSKILHVQCMHFADNQPYQFETRWINTAAVPHITVADLSTVSPNEWLVNHIPFSTAEFTFSASAIDSKVAPHLSMNAGEPVFVAERTTWFDDITITFARMYFHQGYRMITRI
jgi:GntR family histidine utilization transcriptional repressor